MSDEEASSPLRISERRINGWLVLYGPEFLRSYDRLRAEVRRLRNQLPPDEYAKHATVKLFAHLRRFTREIVPANPNAAEFMLKGDLARFRRGKGYGIPDRYRIIWVFSSQRRVIIFLYLNDESTLRKADAPTDPCEVFRRHVDHGRIGADFETNFQIWLDANPDLRESVAAETPSQLTENQFSKRRSRRKR